MRRSFSSLVIWRYQFSWELLKQHRYVACTGIGRDMIYNTISQRRGLWKWLQLAKLSVVSLELEVQQLSEAGGGSKSSDFYMYFAILPLLSFSSAQVQFSWM